MSVPLFTVDAFTDKPFGGNPAAVCLLDSPRDDTWLQLVAREMNLSETAYVWPEAGEFRLRWFTPTVEVKLCGHATLATSHVLWSEGRADASKPIAFHTLSGRLTAARSGELIELDFPLAPAEEAPPPPGMLAALGVQATFVGRSCFDYLVEVASEAEVLASKPDYARLGQIPVRGVILTSRAATGEFDFVSRFFAPAVGVDEDPVCGSAHCCLGAHWQARLGKSELLAHQISERGGVVRVRVVGDRAMLAGHAVTVTKGTLLA